MNNLKVFSYEEKEVRTVLIDGEPWWVAKDICDVFGETNRNRAMQSLDEDEKGYTQMNTPGGNQQLAIVNESGLYALLFAMQPTKARGVSDEYIAERQAVLKKFKKWVTSEVLPSIRKHGAYIMPSKLEEILFDPDLLIELAKALKAERQKNAEQAHKIGELTDKVETLEIMLNDSLEWWTVAKFNGTYNIGWSMEACQHVGRRLTAYCLARAIGPQEAQTNDERFKRVNSYPAMVWHDFMAREGAWLIFPNKRGKQKQKQG